MGKGLVALVASGAIMAGVAGATFLTSNKVPGPESGTTTVSSLFQKDVAKKSLLDRFMGEWVPFGLPDERVFVIPGDNSFCAKYDFTYDACIEPRKKGAHTCQIYNLNAVGTNCGRAYFLNSIDRSLGDYDSMCVRELIDDSARAPGFLQNIIIIEKGKICFTNNQIMYRPGTEVQQPCLGLNGKWIIEGKDEEGVNKYFPAVFEIDGAEYACVFGGKTFKPRKPEEVVQICDTLILPINNLTSHRVRGLEEKDLTDLVSFAGNETFLIRKNGDSSLKVFSLRGYEKTFVKVP